MADGCEIPGDSDFFGLGVRVGSYLQWFALILAGEVAPGQVADIANAISIFQLAFIIAFLWVVSTHPKEAFDVEAFIMTALGAGGGLIITAVHYKKGGTRLAKALTDWLALGVSGCALWLWSSGLNTLTRSPCSWIFMFAKVHMHGHVRYFGLVTSILAVLGSIGSLVQFSLGLLSN